MRAFRTLIWILALVPILTGPLDWSMGLQAPHLIGAQLSQQDFRDPLLNSQIRFFGAIWFGVGLLLMVGLFARCAALALFFYTLVLALIFHAYWAAPAAQARMQASFFFGHLSMMGGMLMVVAFGAGALSLDAVMRRRP